MSSSVKSVDENGKVKLKQNHSFLQNNYRPDGLSQNWEKAHLSRRSLIGR
ncbi:hypothetical protein [Moorena sp. SIO3A5]|nr:hypothetical protein [Moorena sp. SIO3A5]NEP68994.1 hypothetical protein [Moorena sp. SIO3A5]